MRDPAVQDLLLGAAVVPPSVLEPLLESLALGTGLDQLLVLQAALETMRQSDIEANKQVRYLTVSVNPVPSQEASYPRSFENTILAFLVFSGIYLLISLTASVLREQVSA